MEQLLWTAEVLNEVTKLPGTVARRRRTGSNSMKPGQAVFVLAAILSATICAAAGAAGKLPATDRAQASEEAVSLPSGAALFAELDSTLDTKKVKNGDAVIAHTMRDIKSDGKVILPRNTKLVGHVTQASATSKGDPDSTLGIQFDKALPKKGPEIALKVVFRAIAAPERYGPSGGPEQRPDIGAASQTSPMGNGTRGPMPATSPTQTLPGAPTGDADTSGSGAFTESSRGVIGIDGVRVGPPSANARGSFLLVGSGKSVHLEGGTRFLFSIP